RIPGIIASSPINRRAVEPIAGCRGDPLAQEVFAVSVESVPQPSNVRPGHRDPHAHTGEQPFTYPLTRPYEEPDWTRLPGYRDVTKEQWESAQWQRAHSVKNLKEFKEALGEHLSDELYADIERDQTERATMSMLIPPQMLNTMDVGYLYADPVRRYMAPAYSER